MSQGRDGALNDADRESANVARPSPVVLGAERCLSAWGVSRACWWLSAGLIMVLALPAEAASKTVTFSNTCKVKIENGSGWLWQNPWGRTTEIENCAQLRTGVLYWNGTTWTWYFGPGSAWQSVSMRFVEVTGVTQWSHSAHGGRNVSGEGGRCVMMAQDGSLSSFYNC